MINQTKIPLYEALIKHVNKQPISFHVPGHKYGQIQLSDTGENFRRILQIDATELTDLDDLHSPEGAIMEAEALLTELYGVEKSCFLVNGSTVGNLAMIMAACSEDDTVLVQRNGHKSVLNALRLAKASPVFLEPDYDRDWKTVAGISLETVKQAIQEHPNVKAIILTYPNYYGMVYDLAGIIKLAHSYQIPVLVDEAHGSHFIIGDPFPASAVKLGADIVVQSAHKTLPAMTMGSFLHFNSQLLDRSKVKDYLQMLQSSSPSYPIMVSLDLARNYLAAYEQKDLDFLLDEVKRFKNALAKITAIKVLDYPNNCGDFLKITIQSRCGLSGFELQKKFEEQSIYTEMADPNNVLFILPLLKDGQLYPLEETAEKIASALEDMPVCENKGEISFESLKISGLAVGYREMESLFTEDVPLEEAIGHVCAEMIVPYPPGIPLLLKGEKITKEKLSRLHLLLESGARFQGGYSLKKGFIKVFRIS